VIDSISRAYLTGRSAIVRGPVFVKICGITSEADALLAVAAGADAVGLIMAESPRRIEPSVAAGIVGALAGRVLTVGVFRLEDPERIVGMAAEAGVAAVQVHPRRASDVASLRPRVPFLIEAIHAGSADMGRAAHSEADLVLLDAAEPGSGRTFDWSLVPRLSAERRIVLAGGLTPDNVEEAVLRVRPYGVDVASGVELTPGVKDPERVRLFVQRARSADVGS
jgi:phosphoribosylanthranilate isomerase